ncbi:MAG: YceD family protein [Gammaproteobacteria bacterium]
MTAELPSDVDYRRLLADGGTIDGCIGARRLSRVGGNFRVTGAARARIALRRDERGRILLGGTWQAPLEAQCQRCLAWMPLTIEGELELVVVDNADDVPATQEDEEGEDYVAATQGRLPLVALIEDELLLACPMIPLHEDSTCAGAEAGDDGGDDSSATHYKPFADLAALVKAARETDD